MKHMSFSKCTVHVSILEKLTNPLFALLNLLCYDDVQKDSSDLDSPYQLT